MGSYLLSSQTRGATIEEMEEGYRIVTSVVVNLVKVSPEMISLWERAKKAKSVKVEEIVVNYTGLPIQLIYFKLGSNL